MSLTPFTGRCQHCGHDHGENALFDVARVTLTPSQQAQVNERFANYAKQKPHLYGGCDEITTLREQLAALTKERDELKTVPMKYRRMQFNAELQDEVTQLQKQLAALAEQNAKMRKVLLRLACLGNGDQYGNSIGNCIAQEALSLPNLATPVLNRIRAEGMRMASTFISLVRNGWASAGDNLSVQAAEYLISALDARAAELEKS